MEKYLSEKSNFTVFMLKLNLWPIDRKRDVNGFVILIFTQVLSFYTTLQSLLSAAFHFVVVNHLTVLELFSVKKISSTKQLVHCLYLCK